MFVIRLILLACAGCCIIQCRFQIGFSFFQCRFKVLLRFLKNVGSNFMLNSKRLASPRRGRAKPFFFQLAEGTGFEPVMPFGISAFQADALDHYANPPENLQLFPSLLFSVKYPTILLMSFSTSSFSRY